MTIFSIGYEGTTIDQFIDELLAQDIERIIDVRSTPISRKHGFSKTLLSSYLAQAEINYSHLPALGCPKFIRDTYKQDKDWTSYTIKFCRYLKTKEKELENLYFISLEERCALLCFEANFRECHRSLITRHITNDYHIEAKHLTVKSSRNRKTVEETQMAFLR